MDQIKSVALNICIVSIFFGIIKNVLPGNVYEKYMHFVLCLIFFVLIINGIASVLSVGKIDFDNVAVFASDVTQEEQLAIQIKNYINEQLATMGYETVCQTVDVGYTNENYCIEKIIVTNESSDGLNAIRMITGLSEEQIDVQY